MLRFPLKGGAMQKRLDALQRELAALIDTATNDERAELREIEPANGWRDGGESMIPHGNAAAVMQLIAAAEHEEWDGRLPHGSAHNLRAQLRERIVR
jgi:hypothetical protein